MAASNRWLVIVGVAIALAVLAGILVTTFAGGERQYAEGTPERTVQDYLRTVSDRDATAAFAYLTPELTTQCEPKPRESISSRSGDSLRAVLDRTTVRGDTAEVRVNVIERYDAGGPFGGGESNFAQVFVLKQVNGQWRFSESPWPIYCPTPALPVR